MLLLDTDVVVDVLRGYPPAVAWLDSLKSEEIGFPGLVAMELIYGCQTSKEQRQLVQFLSAYDLLWPSSETCLRAFTLLAEVHLRNNIGILDCLIGQMALDLGHPLCTFNRKHYSHVPGLELSEPYQKGPSRS